MTASADAIREREKRWAAGSSVLAAVGLTAFKMVVGIATGSLGILAEAAHSGLDLVAALMTLFAVRISGRPADTEHLYGHGKVENLSALFEYPPPQQFQAQQLARYHKRNDGCQPDIERQHQYE